MKDVLNSITPGGEGDFMIALAKHFYKKYQLVVLNDMKQLIFRNKDAVNGE